MSGTFLIRTRAVVCTPRLTLVYRTSRFTKQCITHKPQWQAADRRLRVLTRAEAEKESEGNPESTEYEQPSDEPSFVGKLFGSYLQLAVWIITLSFAGYKGIQLVRDLLFFRESYSCVPGSDRSVFCWFVNSSSSWSFVSDHHVFVLSIRRKEVTQFVAI